MIMSQQEYNIHFQRVRTLHIKLELLNQFDNVIDRIEGISTDGSINLSGNSAYRRTGSLSLVVKNKSLLPSPSSRIWFNRKIRVYVGLSGHDDVAHWFNQGIFLIKKVDIDRSTNEHKMSLDLVDLMATVDGTFSGQLGIETELLAKGITISEAMRLTLSSLGKVSVDNIIVNGNNVLLPYDLEKDATSTVYDVMSELLGLYMGWEFFVNVHGFYVVQKIKDTKNDPIAWDFTENKMDLVITSSSTINFDNVKNSVVVWGKKLDNGTQPHWIYRNRFARNTISERNLISNKTKGDICFVKNEDKSYCWNDSSWGVLGFNVVPEFNVESIGERLHTFSDDKIFNNDQAMLRAEYELEQKSNLAETINMSCSPIFGLESNEKIRLEDGDYRIDDISVPLGMETMSITATKLYY